MYYKDNSIIFYKIFAFFIILLFSVNIYAQFTISKISPQAERGASFVQVITVDHGGSPFYSSPSSVVLYGTSNITWQSINDYDTGTWFTFHRGRITIPNDIQPGSYRIRLTNVGFLNTCTCADGWITIDDFSTRVSSSSPSKVNLGSQNVQLTMNITPSITNWSNLVIQNVTSTNPGVTYVPGSGRFINGSQISLQLNISDAATIGGLGLYIQYGIPLTTKNKPSTGGVGAQLRVTPQTYGDYATIYLDPASSIVTVEQANPTISTVTPSAVSLGEHNVQLSITGYNFVSGVTLSTTQSGVSFSNTQFISESQLISYVTVSPTAKIGWVPMTVTNPDGRTSTNSQALRVATRRPRFFSASVPTLLIGRSGQQVCISGENFYTGATVIFYSDYVHAREIRVLNETTICMLVDVDANAGSGMVGIAIFNPDGTNDRAMNVFMLSENPLTDRTIQLLYPGIEGGNPLSVNNSNLSPMEMIDTQYPVFRWYSSAWRFKVSIYKPLAGQVSFSEIIRNRPYYEAIVDGANYFQYPLPARALEPGVRYFWKVTAYFGTVPASYYNTSIRNSVDDTSFQGEMKESEVWSFVLRDNISETRETFRFGTLNPLAEMVIEPPYVDAAPGDRLILELRGYDKNHNIAAFIPDNMIINLAEVERNYPDVKLLPKSFGRAELIVPNLRGNDDFRSRLLRNPAEFGRLPILLYISKNAKGVGAVLAMWQNKRYYGFVNILPPKKTMLENGEIDRFKIGLSERLSEAFEVQLDAPAKAGSVISGTGRLFIDAAGFRETGYFPVKIENVRVDVNGRAYTGEIEYKGSSSVTLSGFDLSVTNLVAYADKPASVEGDLLLFDGKDTNKLGFSGKLNAFGDLNCLCRIETDLNLPSAKIPEKSSIEIDFDDRWSPDIKKYDPSFRGLVLSAEAADGTQRRTAVTSPEDLLAINSGRQNQKQPVEIDISKYTAANTENKSEIYLTATRTDSGGINLSWVMKDTKPGLVRIYRRMDDESRYRLIADGMSGDHFTDKFVFADNAYWYKVVALDAESNEYGVSTPKKVQ